MKNQDTDRRKFLKTASLGAVAGAAAINVTSIPSAHAANAQSRKLPREVKIATLTQEGLEAETPDEMINLVFERMKGFESFQPDLVCLPETFPYTHLKRPPLAERAEVPPGPITRRFAEYARKHNCYVICPIYTKEAGRFYNSAVVIDRKGGIMGEYRKLHPTKGEVEGKITAGTVDVPVFDMDFGRVGVQICFDMEYPDGWSTLAKKGAEIVVWSSAYAGGRMVNYRAATNTFNIVSSVNKDTAKICDITGEEVAKTSRWNRWICETVNLEKAFLHSWPFVSRFGEIHAKYGDRVRITNFGEEEWSILESRSPEVRVADIMKEFDLDTITEHLQEAKIAQDKSRV